MPQAQNSTAIELLEDDLNLVVGGTNFTINFNFNGTFNGPVSGINNGTQTQYFNLPGIHGAALSDKHHKK